MAQNVTALVVGSNTVQNQWPEILGWCRTHVGSQIGESPNDIGKMTVGQGWKAGIARFADPKKESGFVWFVAFDNLADELAFKLRWGSLECDIRTE